MVLQTIELFANIAGNVAANGVMSSGFIKTLYIETIE